MGMIPNPTPTTVVMLLFGVSVCIFIMLLPALLELKKPKDAGPRMIMDDVAINQHPQMRGGIPLASIEEEKFRPDQTLVKKIAEVIAFLPNLEA
jgi:hypothetical protein